MEEENKVSVWTGKLDNAEQFKKYIAINYNDDGDMFSGFMTDFGIEYYDTQFQEALFNNAPDKKTALKDFSYIDIFFPKLPSLHLSESNSFILLYNFSYDGGLEKVGDFTYLGTFDYK